MKLGKIMVSALIALGLGFSAAPGAQAATMSMTATPASVQVGKAVTVSGTGCDAEDYGGYTVYVTAGKIAKEVTPKKGKWSVTITPTSVGTLTVRATCSAYWRSDAYKSVTVTVKAAPKKLTATPTPKISGSAVVGKTLTAKPGAWKPSSKLAYQWYAGGAKIKGATKSTFKITSKQKGKKITVKVTGTKAGYTTVTKTSKATAKVVSAFTKAPTPKITGTAKVGKKLTAKAGTWSPKPTLSYQWYAGGSKIKGATKSTFKVTSKQKGKKITVKVTAKKSGYQTVTKTSKATAKVTK
jgi:ribosomal protein L11